MIKSCLISSGIFHFPIAQSLNKNIIRILQDTHLFRSYITQNTNSQSRTGERMTGNQMLRHAQLTSYTANLIFKQQSQGFAQFQVHFFRKSTYIMMTLDYSSGNRKRLDAVRIDRSLSQPFHIFNFMSLFIEYINESLTYNLTLLFRFGHSCQFRKEFSACIHSDNIQTKTFIIVQYIFKFIFAQHAMIHKNTS